MRRKIIVSLALIAGLLSVGAGTAVLLIKTKPLPPTEQTVRPAMRVEAVRLQRQTVIESIVGYGTGRADRYARLSAQVPGEIVGLADNLKPGASFQKNQVLIRIEDQEYAKQFVRAKGLLESERARLARLDVEEQNLDRLIKIATKEVAIAQREYERVARLVEDDQAATREFDLALRLLERTRRELVALENQKALIPQSRAQVTATIGVRQAEVDLAQINVDRCTIVAPFDCRIDKVSVELGERVAPGQPLISLLDPVLIEVPISVQKRPAIGAKCTLVADGMDAGSWTGRVKRISPTANEATRTVDLYVEVNNAEHDQELMPGVFLRAVIEGPALKDVLTVPRGTVQQEQVFVYNDGVAHPHKVHVERHLIDQTIISGIDSDQIVITSNLDALYEGAQVQLEDLPAFSGPNGQTTASFELGELPRIK